MLLVACIALLALPHQAQAQTTVKMVGNGTDSLTYSYLGTNFDGDYREVAQRFTTGSNTGGYTLSTAAIWFGALPTNAADISNFVAAIYTSTSNRPGTLKYTLTNPSGNFATTGRKDFSAPAASTLDAGTKYWLVLKNDNATDGENVTVNSTASGEDSNSLAGWSIQTQRFQRASRSGSWTSSASQLQIRISGYANASDDATLSGLELEDNNGTGITLSPMFASGTTTYTAMVGNPVDEITIDPTVNDTNAAYEIQNSGGTALTDADLNTTGFQVDLSLGANTIKVEVTAEDNTTQTYTVTVTRAAAAPNQPTGLTATAVGGTQINLVWVAPTDNGGATISGYRIEVSADGGTNWTDLLANTGATSVTYSHTGLTRGSTRHYRVSAINAVGTGAASDPTSASTATPTPPAPVEITVPNDWSLIPTGLSTGDKFRLLFLSSTQRNAGSIDIVDYNSFIQGRAAAGHTDIQTYSAGFRAVGCTADSDARDNTATTGTSVVIYWLNGNKAADNYGDFYDGSWDDEANDKDESGNNGPDTTMDGNFPWTGCDHDGTEETVESRALGKDLVRLGRPNSTTVNDGPLSSGGGQANTETHPMYGLSQIFEVAAADNTAATGTPSIDGTPQVGMVLTAAKGTLADADGTTKADNGDTGYAYSYQWLRVDGGTDSPITGATASTYTPVAADVGKTVKVTVSFTDDGGTGEARTSNAFPSSGTIVSEMLPVLSFVPTVVNVDEDAGPAILTVNLAPASSGTVTVDFATRDQVGAAKAGEDYTATSGTLTFTAGQTSKTITVPILNDDVYEAAGATGEIFFVDITNPSGATLPFYPTASVRIDSEDAVPTASMADVTVDEGAGTMTLTLRLNHPSQVDIAYFTRDDMVTGTATEGDDYDDFLLGPPAGIARITVPAFNLSQTFDITLVDDGVDEPDETIVIVWQKVTGAEVTPSTFTFTGTIVPEPLPVLSFAQNIVTVDEDAGSATLTVELAPASTGTVTVDFATRDGVGGAKAGEDYTATSGTLTFAATETSKTFTVPITDDDVYEINESFDVDLSNPTGATLPDPPSTVVRIDSEDAVPTASMADVTVDEGAGTMTLTLRLSHPSDAEIAYFTIYDEDVATGTATEGDDYDDFLLGPVRTARITVPAGDLSQTFDITLVDDSEDEPDETIVILWTVFPNHDATPAAINFTGTITDNDTADNNPTVRFGASSYTAIEGVAGAVVTVELNPAAARAVTILVTATPQAARAARTTPGCRAA